MHSSLKLSIFFPFCVPQCVGHNWGIVASHFGQMKGFCSLVVNWVSFFRFCVTQYVVQRSNLITVTFFRRSHFFIIWIRQSINALHHDFNIALNLGTKCKAGLKQDIDLGSGYK